MSKVIEIKNLQKNFGKVEALKNVTFDVKAGEVVGFIEIGRASCRERV